jgi:hypothetical protein
MAVPATVTVALPTMFFVVPATSAAILARMAVGVLVLFVVPMVHCPFDCLLHGAFRPVVTSA